MAINHNLTTNARRHLIPGRFNDAEAAALDAAAARRGIGRSTFLRELVAAAVAQDAAEAAAGA